MTRGPLRGRRAALATAAASAVLLVAGCTATPSPGTSSSDTQGQLDANVDVDTPALRRMHREAGIEPCLPSKAPVVEDGMPEITLPCLGGGPDVNLSSLRGPMVVNLWASWCGPCREELPYYQQLHETAKGKVDVLGVDYEDTLPGKALALAKETGVTYPSLADPGGRLRVPFKVRGLPAVLFVDEDGKVVHQEFVAIKSYGQLADLVEQHLGVSVGAAG
ncbi:MAG TPA: TlpA disulfide reductase family protein [Nocardioidaceae bacterium]|nr:TlpA disulfide reductase family protein [Nocardioidaceae bacterium]